MSTVVTDQSLRDSLFSEDLLGEVDYLLAAEVLQFSHLGIFGIVVNHQYVMRSAELKQFAMISLKFRVVLRILHIGLSVVLDR